MADILLNSFKINEYDGGYKFIEHRRQTQQVRDKLDETGQSIHHFVEQHAQNINRWGNQAINSTRNSMPLDSKIHQAISNLQNTAARNIDGMKHMNFSHLYEYVTQLPWEAQYRWGLTMTQYALSHNGDMSRFNPTNFGLL